MPLAHSPRGRVYQLNRKPQRAGEHGLPKVPTQEAEVSLGGVEGDFNRYRHEEKHDDPQMALLIMPLEMIEQLNHEGWPIRPGDLGENVTSSGIPYDSFSPGSRFRLGNVRVEITKACTPCDNLYLLPYVGTERGPEFLRTTLGRRGWYARVLDEGTVHRGDPIEAEEPIVP
jgi:MOSC domain-containing protein YiiM